MSNEVTTQPEPKTSYKDIAIAEHGGGGMLMPTNFGEVVSFSELMARSDIAIPKHLRGNPGACMAVTMQAMRWEMDPFSVANKTYFVNDRMAFEAQLVAAVVATRAPISRRPDYEFTGEGPTLKCRVSAEMLDGSVKVYESPPFGAITTKNSPLWKSDPQQQLGYYSIRAWARRHAPEVLLGVYTPDELAEDKMAARAAPDAAVARLASKLAGAKSEGGFSREFVTAEIGDGRAPIEGEIIQPEPNRAAASSPASPAADGGEGERLPPESSSAAPEPAGECHASPAPEGDGGTSPAAVPDPMDKWRAEGAKARKAGKSIKNPPLDVRNNPEALAAWREGYGVEEGEA